MQDNEFFDWLCKHKVCFCRNSIKFQSTQLVVKILNTKSVEYCYRIVENVFNCSQSKYTFYPSWRGIHIYVNLECTRAVYRYPERSLVLSLNERLSAWNKISDARLNPTSLLIGNRLCENSIRWYFILNWLGVSSKIMSISFYAPNILFGLTKRKSEMR